jgi:plasma-membrane proton-efflux P-type ATPase
MNAARQPADSARDRIAPGPTAAETLAALGSDGHAGLREAEAAARLAHHGPNDVPEKQVHPLVLLARKFWGLSAWMLELIAILSGVLHKYTDLVIVLALLLLNAVIGFLQEQRASAAVAALRGRLRVTSRVLREASWKLRPARELVRGDVVRLRAGDFVPADVQLIEGAVRVDQSALTGESRELEKNADDILNSGSIVRRGEATAVVFATGVDTWFGHTTQLVASARPKMHVEEVVARVVRWLLWIVGAQLALAVIGALSEGLPLLELLPLALVVLMGAIPVALPVMFTVSTAVGSMELARRGVLITRLNAVEDAANMDMVCIDKTGTLTLNRLSVVGALPQPRFTADDVLRCGALASHEADQDPIDLAFLRAAHGRHLLAAAGATRAFQPFSPQTRRTEAVVEIDGRTERVMKGAVRTLAQATALDGAALAAIEARAEDDARRGLRTLAVAQAVDGGPLRLVGVALLADPVRPDSSRLLQELDSLGVAVKMLTGDALPVAAAVARDMGLGRIIRATELQAADGATGSAARIGAVAGVAEVFPEDKYHIVRTLQAAGHVVGMTGDGVNDAPALRQAEVGIAVSNATDVAKGAAGVVLTQEGLVCIVDLVKSGRAIYQRVLTWIVNKISRTILKTGLVVIPFLVTGRFVVSALAVVLLVFMTDFAKIALATDRVHPSRAPETWNIAPLVRLAVALGLLMLVESLGLLALGWHWLGLGADAGRLRTFTFLMLLFFALFSLLSIRERRAFWSSRPSGVLALALAADGGLGLLIGTLGLGDMSPLPPPQAAYVCACALVCALLINDRVKLILIRHLSGSGDSSRPRPPSA